MNFGVCGWIETVNGFTLPFVFSREVCFVVPQLAWMSFVLCLLDFVDLICTLLVQWLPGKYWWVLQNFDWYPKSPK